MLHYKPSIKALNELWFKKNKDFDNFELKATKKSTLYYDSHIELPSKFYAIEDWVEHLLEFENREDVELFIKTLKWLKK